MTLDSVVLVEIWRGDVLESVHRGAAAVCDSGGALLEAWGDPSRVILPRSAYKMLQALPLVESGAADAAALTPQHLALACASHRGMAIHTDLVRAWLRDLGLGDGDLRCGAHSPVDRASRIALRQAGLSPEQVHNNCSGKHAGFLTLSKHLGAGPDYIDPAHPVQLAVREAVETCCDETAARSAIDGCSAPNLAMTLTALARAMARFARPGPGLASARRGALDRLRTAMHAHPALVSGDGGAATELMQAATGGAVAKSGAEGVFVAALPERGLGIAVKIDDGSQRGSEAAIAALMARYGALDPAHPTYQSLADAPIRNVAGLVHGHLRATATLTG